MSAWGMIEWPFVSQISAHSSKGEPTKPTEPGFVGASSGECSNIRSDREREEASCASRGGRPERDIKLGLDSATQTTPLMSCGANFRAGRLDAARRGRPMKLFLNLGPWESPRA